MANINKQAGGASAAPNARLTAVQVISSVFSDGAYANIALSKALGKQKHNEQDRRFVTELVYGTVKAKGTIDWLLGQLVSRPLGKIDPMILNILRLGVFQIYFLERIPASAACNESVNLAKKFGHTGSVKFVNGVLRQAVRSKESIVYPDAAKEPKQYLALKEFHPDWLVKRWLKQFGFEGAEALCRFDNEPPPLTLRVNTLVTDRKTLLAGLLEDGFEAEPSKWCEDGIVCTKIPSLGILFDKYNNMFYVQDESSMLVAPILAPQPVQTVIDVCSAPGGKTTHLAQLMQNKGIIYATDIHEHKLKLIEENCQRLGINIIKASVHDAAEFNPEWEGLADCVLVDAPCSGLGVLRRRAEARWTKNKLDLKTFPPLQRDILRNAASYVKPGGRLVYSTCTLEQAENHYIPAEFLENNPNWKYAGFVHPLTGETVDELQLLPQRDGTDGFYICALARKE
ncbi:16S rRNA (cytosine(967)-C(5))-methyltransferase RsmB [uncultured Phascolarctobacterium sp.]|uniref:16S rRNA (cytosine(967)-C(5))-methyltransferase RsmB n=1 Tax=uncultured Phascolarctobacterium sp. TaxID=512296 RepID=UPI0025CFD777|nr:16S rRNA (cytosine(967)-C(5))-methyltransferase RsmB [uncultured Phascolarctobacterium sp.]